MPENIAIAAHEDRKGCGHASVAYRYLSPDENLTSYVDTSEGIEAVVVAALRKDGDNSLVGWRILALPEHLTLTSDRGNTVVLRTAISVEPLSAYLRARGIPTSPAVRLGDLVFVSGFPPFSETGTVEAVSIERQIEIAIEQMKVCLEAAGSSLDKIAKCNVYADDAAHFETINRVYERYFQKDAPARIFICVAGWPGPFNLEIDCIAAA